MKINAKPICDMLLDEKQRVHPPVSLAKWRIEDLGDLTSKWEFARGYTFGAHTHEVVKMAKSLMSDRGIGYQLYKALRLRRFSLSFKQFRKLILLAALLHDMGKASLDFQVMLYALEDAYQKARAEGITDKEKFRKRLKDARFKQRYRHEALSGWLISFYSKKTGTRPLWDWLVHEAGGESFAKAILWAVIGHHRKTDRGVRSDVSELKVQAPKDWDSEKLNIYTTLIVEELSSIIRKEGLPFSPLPDLPQGELGILRKSLKDMIGHFDSLTSSWASEAETPLTFALKVLLMTADWWGSMVPDPEYKKGYEQFRRDILRDINKSLGDVPPTDLRKHPATKDLLGCLFPTQKKALKARGNVANLGATGDGKTVSDLLALANPRTLLVEGRVLFTTPTTNLAAQILLDTNKRDGKYQPSKDRLRSSRSALDHILWVAEEADEDEDTQQEEDADLLRGLGYLRDFRAPTTFCTVDQVLGLLTYSRNSILFLPYILKARIVFDECHNYDPRLMAYFHRFLEWFPDIDCVFSSATMTEAQVQKIREYRPDLTVIRNVKGDLASHKRFRFHFVDIPTALTLFDATSRTLWYVNMVRNAQDLGQRFPDALVHHSRRQYEKRVAQHKVVVDSFRSGDPVRCVTTQIAEIGIDMVAGRLISEMCPVADFIQRIGRATLRGKAPDRITDVYIYDPMTARPYDEKEIEEARPFFEIISQGGTWSQAELNALFHQMYPGKVEDADALLAISTRKYPLRGIENMTTAILASDLDAAKAAYKEEWNKGLQRFEFNVPFHRVHDKGLDRYRFRYVVPYREDPRLGVIFPVKDPTPFFDQDPAQP